MAIFKEILINARKQKGLLKKDVADLFEWTPMYYGRYETGRLLPTKSNIKKFAEFIGINEAELQKIIDESRGIKSKC